MSEAALRVDAAAADLDRQRPVQPDVPDRRRDRLVGREEARKDRDDALLRAEDLRTDFPEPTLRKLGRLHDEDWRALREVLDDILGP